MARRRCWTGSGKATWSPPKQAASRKCIRAWRVDHGGQSITFLDTPGHEAFTKMRARGAQVTDIAVIVVAADDGVMPQTEEAINHAKAAGVPIVVAINKVDLPNANLNKTRQQLYGLGLLPDNMGGDTPFVETAPRPARASTSCSTTLSIVAELKELKANPNRPAAGTCLEAMLSEGEGVRATLLVQNGTLCGEATCCCAAQPTAVFGPCTTTWAGPSRKPGRACPCGSPASTTCPTPTIPSWSVPDLADAREIAEKRQASAWRPPRSNASRSNSKR